MADLSKRGASRLLDRWRPMAIVLGSLVAVNVLAHVFIIRPVVRVSGDRSAILDTARQRLAHASAQLDAFERTASKHACTVSDANFVFENVLSSKGARMTAIQRELRKLARDNRLDPERLSYETSPLGQSGLAEFSVSFPLEGPYETLRKFIESVEASPNFLIVRNVGLTGDRTLTTGLRLQVIIGTYFVDPDLGNLTKSFPTAKRRSS